MAETGTPHRHGHEHHQQPGATGRARQEEGQHQERHWTHLWTQAQESRQKGILSVWSKLGLYVGTGFGGGGRLHCVPGALPTSYRERPLGQSQVCTESLAGPYVTDLWERHVRSE